MACGAQKQARRSDVIKRNAVVALAGSQKRKKAVAGRLAVGGVVFSILLYLYFKLVAVVEGPFFWG